MKKFLIKVLVFSWIIATVLFSIEIMVRAVPNEYSYKYNYLENNIYKVHFLALGASVSRSGIDPSCFTQTTFNAAQVSQDLEEDCAIVMKYLDRADSLKAVVIPIIPVAYSSRMMDGIERWRLRKYHIYMDLDVDWPPLSECMEISNLPGCIGQIMKYYRGEDTVECFETGMGTDSIVENEDVKLSQAVRVSKMHNDGYNPDNYSKVIPALRSMLSACRDANVDVYVVIAPCYYTYRERILSAVMHDCDSISMNLENDFSNMHYINMFGDSTFTTEDFRNSNHLSKAGAAKFSRKLNDILNK